MVLSVIQIRNKNGMEIICFSNLLKKIQKMICILKTDFSTDCHILHARCYAVPNFRKDGL